MAHKKNRALQLGEHVTLIFEDELTIRYQVQEMLRAERIFESEAIAEELEAYNPLIPDGTNLKATMMLEYPDAAERRVALARLRGNEHRGYLRVGTLGKVLAHADAERVMASLTRSVEGQLKLVVNRVKSQAAPLKQCAFLGFQIGARARAVWTTKAQARFKRRVKEITRRNRVHRVQDVIGELRRYITGWLNYFGLSDTYSAVLELEEWVRRRVRLYYWKQWKQPRTRRRHLLALGIPREEVHMAPRSRKGYWRMSANRILQRTLTNRRLQEHGVPDMRTLWIGLHYGPNARV